MPEKLERCVQDLIAKGKTKESAYAICNASLYGKGWTVEQTVDFVEANKAVLDMDLIGLMFKPQDTQLDYSYAKSIGSEIPIEELAVKFISPNILHGYVVLWGQPDKVDMDREFFTKETNFWDAELSGMKRVLTDNHAANPETKADPVIGEIVDMGDDKWGRWYDAQIKRNLAYREYLDKLVQEKRVGTSSDSVPQYVLREKVKSGATWLKRWPLFGAALTPTPCEPRQLGTVDFYKSLGLVLPEPEASEEQTRQKVMKAIHDCRLLKFNLLKEQKL